MSEIAAEQTPDRKRFIATLIGFSAVLMWALLALFTAASGAVARQLPVRRRRLVRRVPHTGACGRVLELERWRAVPHAQVLLPQLFVIGKLPGEVEEVGSELCGTDVVVHFTLGSVATVERAEVFLPRIVVGAADH